MFEEYARYDGLGLAELIRTKQVSAKEVLEAAVLQAEFANPALNAMVLPLYDHAHARLADVDPDAPLAYVPFLLKDVHHALAGTPMSNGSSLQKGELSKENAAIVQRWLDAGLVTFGKTNTPEYKLSPTTHPAAWGATRNPWDVIRTPGGSSGGSAAAVAAGIAPLASATDEAGSIRTPASQCGVFGLKPSRGRNPIGPDFGWRLEGLSTSHVITRSVRDSAAALDATSGSEPGGPYHCPETHDFLASLSEAPSRLRVALCTDSRVFGRTMDAHCVAAIRHAGKLLTDLGHEVEEVSMPFDENEAMTLAVTLVLTGFAGFAERLVEDYGARTVRQHLEPLTQFVWRAGQAVPKTMREEIQARSHTLAQELAGFHERYHVLVNSTLCTTPKRIEETDPTTSDVRLAGALCGPGLRWLMRAPRVLDKLIETQLEALIDRVPFRTSIANLTGQPAMSVPLFWTPTGLPIGVQFLGPFGSERMLLKLAAQLEEAQPWANRLPIRTP